MGEKEMGRVNLICCTAAALTEEDFKEIEQIIEDQLAYNMPLQPTTTDWQHKLGEYNKRVLDKVRELKDLIAEGDSIVQPEEKIKIFDEGEEQNV